MVVVSVSVLKAKLSEYVRHVKAGETVVVTERGKPIGQFQPLLLPETDEEERARLERLAAQGLIRLGTRRLPKDFWDMPRPKVPGSAAVEAVLKDRQERDDALLGRLGRDTAVRR
jgi:prevent-host-death family protein